MRYALLALLSLLGVPAVANAQLSIGITIGAYPHFDTVPGYPVYYATDVASNYFFFDGLYWVYQDDNWYSSSWYDGPWDAVDPIFVPVYLLQVPVRYFRRPPMYFRGWQSDRAPRWGEHWGRDWDQRRSGWDRPRAHLAPAPLPDYQRQYSGSSYPKGEQQRALRDQNYRYRPAAGNDRPRPGANSRPAPETPAQPGRGFDRPMPDRSSPDRPAQRDTRQDRPTGNLPSGGDARRNDAQRQAPTPQAQRPSPQAPVQQPPRRQQEQQQSAPPRQAQRQEAQGPEVQRPAQQQPQRATPQREQRQPTSRQDAPGRQDGAGNSRGRGNANGKSDDNRLQER
jgi:hypothetical protein